MWVFSSITKVAGRTWFVSESVDGDLDDMYGDDEFQDNQYGSSDEYEDFDETWN